MTTVVFYFFLMMLIVLTVYAGWLNLRIIEYLRVRPLVTFLFYLWVFDRSAISEDGWPVRSAYLRVLSATCVTIIVVWLTRPS